MLYTYNTATQNLDVDDAVVFGINAVQTGKTSTHASGTSVINLNKPGYYKIDFTAVATSPSAIQMYVNGVAAPGAITLIAGASTGEINAIVPVDCVKGVFDNNPQEITFISTITGTVLTNAAVTVTRLA